MSDIIEKLRGPNPVSWLPEAIHEIERLRAALIKIGDHKRFGWTMQTEIAKKALEPEHE